MEIYAYSSNLNIMIQQERSFAYIYLLGSTSDSCDVYMVIDSRNGEVIHRLERGADIVIW